MEDEKVMISTVEIMEYLYDRLLIKGYAPTSDEVFDLADIFFAFLVMKSAINPDEIEDYEDDEEEL